MKYKRFGKRVFDSVLCLHKDGDFNYKHAVKHSRGKVSYE